MRVLKKSAVFLISVTMAAVGGASTASASTTIDQLGSDIDGEAVGDSSGGNVVLSADGTIVAISASQNDGSGSDAGHVRLFEWDGAAWVQRGDDIDGEAADDWSGHSVSLSSNGSIVAISAILNDGVNGNDSGHVRVYEWDGSAWQQKGGDIDGEAADDYSGRSVSLSADGNIVAIGATNNDGSGSDAGHVRLFEWDGAAWVQKGGDIDGEAADDYSGHSVSLSADGSIVAISAIFNDGINGETSGHVRVYEWDGSAWQQKGGDIDGESANDESGLSVSLSADGTIVAIGAHLNDGINGEDSGHVRVYSIATTQNITTPEPDENVELPATGSMSGIVSQVLLVLGAGGLLMLFSRRRLSVRD